MLFEAGGDVVQYLRILVDVVVAVPAADFAGEHWFVFVGEDWCAPVNLVAVFFVWVVSGYVPDFFGLWSVVFCDFFEFVCVVEVVCVCNFWVTFCLFSC